MRHPKVGRLSTREVQEENTINQYKNKPITRCYPKQYSTTNLENNIEVIQSHVRVEVQDRKSRFPKRLLAQHVKEDQISIRVRNKLL
jgi:hypothetical protein